MLLQRELVAGARHSHAHGCGLVGGSFDRRSGGQQVSVLTAIGHIVAAGLIFGGGALALVAVLFLLS